MDSDREVRDCGHSLGREKVTAAQPAEGVPSRRGRGSDGFSLIEVVTALSLLAVVALSMGGGLVATLRANRSISEREQARTAVASQLEEILAWPDFDTLTSMFHDRIFAAGDLQGLAGPGTLPGSVQVESVNPLLLNVVVRAEWAGVDGDNSFELTTMVSNLSPDAGGGGGA